MKQLEHAMVDLADLHKQCQFQCSLKTQGENSAENFQRAKSLAAFPHQHLSILGVPSLFEFIENVAEVQSSHGIFAEGFVLHNQLVNKVLEALTENEPQCVQDLKN